MKLRNIIRNSNLRISRPCFSRTNLKGKSLSFEWQHQTSGPDKTAAKWQTPEEINQQKRTEFQQRMEEDFRLDMFGLRQQPKPVAVEEDELFGKQMPRMKPFDTAHIKEVYNQAVYQNKGILADQKLSYLPNFVAPFEITERVLNGQVERIKEKVEAFIQASGHFSEKLADSDWERFYTEPEMLEALERLALLIQRANQVSIPSLILRLSRELHYNRDYSPKALVFKEIERSLGQVLHIMSFKDLVRVYFGLTYTFPKKCSTELRLRIKEKIAGSSFDALAIEDLLETYTAFKNDLNSLKIHKKCLKCLIDNFEAIKRLCVGENHALALNVVYTFANARPSKRFRKKVEIINGEEVAEQLEKDEIERLYMPLVIENAGKYNAIEIIRLLSVFKVLNYKNYDEVYPSVERFVLENAKSLPLQHLAFILHYMSKTNNKGFGSRSFWTSVAGKILPTLKINSEASLNDIARILEALTTNKALDFPSFEKHFGAFLTEKLRPEQPCSYHELAMLASSFAFLDCSPKNKDSMRSFLKALVVKLSFQTEWVPLLYYHSIKLFTYYVSKRHPSWNLEFVYNLCYHAEKSFNTERLRTKVLPTEHAIISGIVQKDFEMALMSFVDFENLFLIDFAIEEYKFAIVLQKDSDCLYAAEGEHRTSHPLFDLRREILALHDWTVCTVDYAEFAKLKEKRASWLKEKIQEHFKRAVEKAGNLKEERVAEAVQRIERIATMDLRADPTYPAHVAKAQVIEKARQRDAMKKIQK